MKIAGVFERGGMCTQVGAGAATLASVRVPRPGGGSRLGQRRFFSWI